MLLQSLINLEPVAESINRVQPEHYLPAFNLGSELAKTYNSCSVPGYDFETWHDGLDCPRIMIETAVRWSRMPQDHDRDRGKMVSTAQGS